MVVSIFWQDKTRMIDLLREIMKSLINSIAKSMDMEAMPRLTKKQCRKLEQKRQLEERLLADQSKTRQEVVALDDRADEQPSYDAAFERARGSDSMSDDIL